VDKCEHDGILALGCVVLPRQDTGDETTVRIVAGDTAEGIADGFPSLWCPAAAYEVWRGELLRKREGQTWGCPSGGQWIVVADGDDEEWREVAP
jgi:hypothetical protein